MNFFLVIIVLCISIKSISQNSETSSLVFQKKNNFNVELGGFGVIGSVGYERILINNPRFKTTGQISLGVSSLPVMVNQIISFKKHHLEFGIGVIMPSFFEAAPYPSWRMGYRFQKPDGRLLFRAGLMTVILGWDEGDADMFLWVWPGVSVGRVF
jgi:hypothetical protein